MPAARHVAVWIDHKEAKIFALTRDSAGEWKLHPSDPPKHLHHKAGLGDAGKAPPDEHYFHGVADAVKDAAEILIVGPSTAKTELKAHLERHDPQVAKKVVGVETVDHPTDNQLVAFARKFFKAADRLRPA